MNANALNKTELNKILSITASYATLEQTKRALAALLPQTNLSLARKNLKFTEECLELLFSRGIGKIEQFPEFSDELDRAKKGSTLSCAELLCVCALLRSARIAHTSVASVTDGDFSLVRELSNKLYFDTNLEDDISEKILSDTQVSDYASEKLYSIRRDIRLLNERIRSRLAEYLTGGEGKYLQDAIVTMRNDRYVLPVRAEYKRNVKGFVHDRSASGATFFIEPEEVLEMNNELRSLAVDEKEEVERILHELSLRVGMLAERLQTDIILLQELDGYFARAEFSYHYRCVLPQLNEQGIVKISEGRHPLIDKNKVVPVSISLGEEYRFLLVSGPNTGGKTVTLKMVGLFCLMAMCGLFVPAKSAVVSVFDQIFCDIGDAQSIEESLSTFSSHVKNIIYILDNATQKSLVLIDELGGGTDPEEGQALAQAIVKHLLSIGGAGVVTTHYSALKEFAFSTAGIENACMEFDTNTLQPLYVMKIGLPGSSNALAISRRLGLKESILQDALLGLSDGARTFENIVRSAEQSRIEAENALQETNEIKAEWAQKVALLQKEEEKLQKEKEKFFSSAKAESRRIVSERTAQAEELLAEIESIFAQDVISEADLIKARTLKNKLAGSAYEMEEETSSSAKYLPIDEKTLKVGDTVFIKSMSATGTIQSIRQQKGEAEVLCGNLRLRMKFSDLLSFIAPKTTQTETKKKLYPQKQSSVSVQRNLSKNAAPLMEVNVIGMTVMEAIPEVESFLDSAVLSNLEEVRIVHGMGTGRLRKGIHEYLRKQPHVAEFRLGIYGEGESGVTIVKLK